MRGPRLILGLREVSRPVGDGYIYYKCFPNEADRILLFLNLYNTSEIELESLFRQSILKIARKEQLSIDGVKGLLSGYSTENMRPGTQEVLARVVSLFVNSVYERKLDKLDEASFC